MNRQKSNKLIKPTTPSTTNQNGNKNRNIQTISRAMMALCTFPALFLLADRTTSLLSQSFPVIINHLISHNKAIEMSPPTKNRTSKASAHKKTSEKSAWDTIMDTSTGTGTTKQASTNSRKKVTSSNTGIHSPPASSSPVSKKADLKSTPPRTIMASPLVSSTPDTKAIMAVTPPPPPSTKTTCTFKSLDADDFTLDTAAPSVDSSATDSRASKLALLKLANQAVKDNYIWSFETEGKFSEAHCTKTWASIPKRIWVSSTSYRHFFSKTDGDDKASIYDTSQRAFPGIFDLSSVTSSNWRKAPLPEILAFAKELFQSPAPEWLGSMDASRARKCMISLSMTRPDKFDSFYSKGNMNESTEGLFWIAANTVLGSRWNMTAPSRNLATIVDSKGNKKVAFHRAPGATVKSGRSGTYIRQAGNCSGDCQAPIDVTAEVHRTPSTYITIELPRVTPPNNEMYDSALTSQLDVFRALGQHDPTSLIYVFPTKARNNLMA